MQFEKRGYAIPVWTAHKLEGLAFEHYARLADSYEDRANFFGFMGRRAEALTGVEKSNKMDPGPSSSMAESATYYQLHGRNRSCVAGGQFNCLVKLSFRSAPVPIKSPTQHAKRIADFADGVMEFSLSPRPA